MNEKEIQAESRDLHIEHVPTNSQDEVAEEAKGGDLSEMPPGYYRNWRFIGSVLAVAFMAQGLYLGSFKFERPPRAFTDMSKDTSCQQIRLQSSMPILVLTQITLSFRSLRHCAVA